MAEARLSLPLLVTACLAAILLPPVSVFVTRRADASFFVNVGLFVTALLVFWYLWAGPGLMLLGSAVVHALVVIVLSGGRVPPHYA